MASEETPPSTSYVSNFMVAAFVLVLLGIIYYMTRTPKKEKATEESSDTDGFDVAAEVDKLRTKQDLYKSS